jgi:hypothetical protein
MREIRTSGSTRGQQVTNYDACCPTLLFIGGRLRLPPADELKSNSAELPPARRS